MTTEIVPFAANDSKLFLALARQEKWLCAPWEFDFLLQTFPDGCFTARVNETAAGFITSVTYNRSGWIGNLIVSASNRGQGIGRALMERALAALDAAGTETVWLTASAAGRPLYESLGFSTIDTVCRWTGTVKSGPKTPQGTASLQEINAIDSASWGDHRESLITAILQQGGHLFANGNGFLIVQRQGRHLQVGPWESLADETAAELLKQGLAVAGTGSKVFLDSPAGNRSAARLLQTHGFTKRGSASLMYRGNTPAFMPQRVFALASMGSMG